MLQAGEEAQTQQGISEHFEYGFTLASFEQTIKHNFQLVQKLLEQHQRSINQLQLQILAPFEARTSPSQIKQQIDAKQQERAQNKSKQERQQNDRQGKNSRNEVEGKAGTIQRSQGNMEKQAEAITVANKQQQDLAENDNNLVQAEVPLHRTQMIDQTQAFISGSNKRDLTIEEKKIFSEHEKEAFQSKMFQLFERVRKLEEQELLTVRRQNKKFQEFQFALENCNKSLEKAQQSQDLYKDEVEKLRNELTQYKLKKQSKINKLLHSNSLSQSSIGNDSYDYIAEKLQFLLKHVKELLTKKSFEDERDILQQNVEILRKKLNDTINEGYLEESLKNTQIKIYNSIVKYVKSVKHKRGEGAIQEGEEENELEKMIAEENSELIQKVGQQQEKIKQLGQRIDAVQLQLELARKQKLQTEEQINDQFKVIQDDQRALEGKISLLEKNDQEMRHDFTQKHVESEGQIIDLQEQLERINSQLKTYSYAFSDRNASPNVVKLREAAENQAGSLLELSSQLQVEKVPNDKSILNTSVIQQELSLLKKKISKMSLKIQGVKQDLLGVRKDLNQDIEGLKVYLQKKADWESLKKALSYFDEKTKQTKIVLEHLYNTSMQRHEGNGDDSLAVKKGWTCLMCDRDIKNYEGKLSQAKFTSMFPIRESPRIGGYYKQQQMTQEYKQVFLNNPVNTRGKRMGSLRSNPTNQSKQQLYG